VDELITAVFKDLTEYTSWMLLDRRLRCTAHAVVRGVLGGWIV
jgi:hypothetical protein